MQVKPIAVIFVVSGALAACGIQPAGPASLQVSGNQNTSVNTHYALTGQGSPVPSHRQGEFGPIQAFVTDNGL